MASVSSRPLIVPEAGTTSAVKPSQLHTFHRNARIGDVDAIASSLKANGQFRPIVVNIGTHTGRDFEVLAGNHTLKAFRTLSEQDPFNIEWQQILVHWVDVDEDMATRIVLVDNRSFENGDGYDTATLTELLKETGTEGTGYADADLAALEAALHESAEASDGGAEDPEPPSLPPRSQPAISFTVLFDDEGQQTAWFEFLKWLQNRYDDPDLTVAERLVKYLAETQGDRS